MSQRALIPHWPGLSWVSVSGWIRYLSIENCCSFFITFNQSISQSIKLYWSLAGNQWTNGEYNNTYVSARSLSWWRFVCGCNQRAKCAVFLHLSRWLTFPMYYKYWSHYLNIYCECIWTISIKKCTKIPDQWAQGRSCPVCGLELLLFFISACGYRLESKHN